VRDGCGLSPYLFNIFINYVTDYINESNNHAPAVGKVSIQGPLFADDLALGCHSYWITEGD
jgi:hypothetical protein